MYRVPGSLVWSFEKAGGKHSHQYKQSPGPVLESIEELCVLRISRATSESVVAKSLILDSFTIVPTLGLCKTALGDSLFGFSQKLSRADT